MIVKIAPSLNTVHLKGKRKSVTPVPQHVPQVQPIAPDAILVLIKTVAIVSNVPQDILHHQDRITNVVTTVPWVILPINRLHPMEQSGTIGAKRVKEVNMEPFQKPRTNKKDATIVLVANIPK